MIVEGSGSIVNMVSSGGLREDKDVMVRVMNQAIDLVEILSKVRSCVY